ncbi:metal ABC transporter substrate-binding protein [Azoarcus sp. L1K30]|uniref:metal ABC transporter substrate-binding protein n=1 Tax=Azoarcus sp. L1K30 TaxID=2820277 RepID=UPI001B810283|nr:metal ABC transporter substrate-binding protein [Azoarcus sp. L1K30]MBR0567694.1 metal ABC transporter substrate-binding protein [Azoarcus sp. L1K30]
MLSLSRFTAILFVTLSLSPGAAQAAPIDVTASFSILGDMVREVGGERIRVQTLVGADEDAHAFQPRPSDSRRIGNARLVVVNGLGFDDWMARLARSGGYKGPVVIASRGVTTLAMDADKHGHGHGIDPHAWQDVGNAQRYVDNIATALIEVDPEGADTYRANAARYAGELKVLDAQIREALGSLSAAQRKVVSSHDAFGYFAHAYDLQFLSPVGVSNDAEPTAKGVARLIQQLRKEKVPAVFIENISDPRLSERISAESGAVMGGTLYSDALSAASGPAPTYVTMMRHNLHTLMAALTSAPPAR